MRDVERTVVLRRISECWLQNARRPFTVLIETDEVLEDVCRKSFAKGISVESGPIGQSGFTSDYVVGTREFVGAALGLSVNFFDRASDIYCAKVKTKSLLEDRIRFTKIHNTHSDDNITNIDLIYLSGYLSRDVNPPDSATTIGPKWPHFTPDLSISGVNLISDLISEFYPDLQNQRREIKYRACYIGASSINKNALFSLLVLFFSRLFASPHMKPDIMIVKKFSGLWGIVNWYLLKISAALIRLLKIDIYIHLTDQAATHREILETLSASENVLVLYLREGFPRVIGEAAFFGCHSLIWKFCAFGFVDACACGAVERLSLKQIFDRLRGENLAECPETAEFYSYEYVERRLKKAVNPTLKQLTRMMHLFEPTVRPLMLYLLLTSDFSWVRDRLAQTQTTRTD